MPLLNLLGQWSEGLVSAARMVAAATHSLCEAANSLVQGNSSEEKLIAAAKQVNAAHCHVLTWKQLNAVAKHVNTAYCRGLSDKRR